MPHFGLPRETLSCACVSVTHVTHVHALSWLHVSIPLTANSYSLTFQYASRWWQVIPLDNMPDDNPYETSRHIRSNGNYCDQDAAAPQSAPQVSWKAVKTLLSTLTRWMLSLLLHRSLNIYSLLVTWYFFLFPLIFTWPLASSIFCCLWLSGCAYQQAISANL